jgi:hypothetical protein
LNDTGVALLHPLGTRFDIQMSYPPVPPGRFLLNHRAVRPSGLRVNRMSANSVEAMPGANKAASPTISSAGDIGAPLWVCAVQTPPSARSAPHVHKADETLMWFA